LATSIADEVNTAVTLPPTGVTIPSATNLLPSVGTTNVPVTTTQSDQPITIKDETTKPDTLLKNENVEVAEVVEIIETIKPDPAPLSNGNVEVEEIIDFTQPPSPLIIPPWWNSDTYSTAKSTSTISNKVKCWIPNNKSLFR